MEEFRRATGYEDLAYSIMDQEPELAVLRAENVKVICVISDAGKKDRNGLKVYAKYGAAWDRERSLFDDKEEFSARP